MRAYRTVALFTVIALSAADAVAQSAELKMSGARNGRGVLGWAETLWLSQDGNTCRIRSPLLPPHEQEVVDKIWYAPAAADPVSTSNASAQQMKALNSWPLAVGKKIQARNDGAAHNGSYSGSWIMTLTVEKAEKITTMVGTFDSFVVVLQVEGLLKNLIKSTFRQWYAPGPGVVVKMDYQDNRAQKQSGEATVIRH
jgi:hypothetical protein